MYSGQLVHDEPEIKFPGGQVASAAWNIAAPTRHALKIEPRLKLSPAAASCPPCITANTKKGEKGTDNVRTPTPAPFSARALTFHQQRRAANTKSAIGKLATSRTARAKTGRRPAAQPSTTSRPAQPGRKQVVNGAAPRRRKMGARRRAPPHAGVGARAKVAARSPLPHRQLVSSASAVATAGEVARKPHAALPLCTMESPSNSLAVVVPPGGTSPIASSGFGVKSN